MQKQLNVLMSAQESVWFYATTFTVVGIESTVYSVVKKNIASGEAVEYHQFDTEVKAQRKFNRLTHTKTYLV